MLAAEGALSAIPGLSNLKFSWSLLLLLLKVDNDRHQSVHWLLLLLILEDANDRLLLLLLNFRGSDLDLANIVGDDGILENRISFSYIID